MRAIVDLVYTDKESRRITVPCKGKGNTLLNSIDRSVEKAAADDKEWVRWNLVEVTVDDA